MTTIGEEAKNYQPQATGVISDLDIIKTDIPIEDDSFIDNEGKEVKIKVITVNEKKYRVPWTVLSSLRTIMAENPNLKTFKVKRQGTGQFDTRYTVIPLG